METKTTYEEEILKEVQGLPQAAQERLAKMVRFLSKEIIRPDSGEKNATAEFLSVCGTWEDDRTIGKQIKDIHSSRKSTKRTERIF